MVVGIAPLHNPHRLHPLARPSGGQPDLKESRELLLLLVSNSYQVKERLKELLTIFPSPIPWLPNDSSKLNTLSGGKAKDGFAPPCEHFFP
jgi:hypothetical protein